MEKNALPQKMVGNWIWMTEERHRGESRQFFRRDFVIDQLPASAELWIAASTSFQLCFNGRLTGLHQQCCPKEGCVYVMHLPAIFLLQQGANQIAVQVFDAGEPLGNHPDCQPGLWLQLDIDDKPFLWTDSDWMGLIPGAYIASDIRQSVGGPQIEMVDFRNYPRNWQNVPFTPFRNSPVALPPTAPTTDEGAEMRWKFPRKCIPVDLMSNAFVPYSLNVELTERRDWDEIHGAGRYLEENQTLWVNFRAQTKSRKGGLFVAETYMYSRCEAWYSTECYCDRPYRLFLNDAVISEQAVPKPPVHAVAECRGEQPLDIDEYAPIEVSTHLVPGWNHFFLVLDAASSGHGLTVVFKDCKANSVAIHCRPDERTSASWIIAGPLRTPFSQVTTDLPMEELKRSEFILEDNPAWDMSVMQRAFVYRPGKVVEIDIDDKKDAVPGQNERSNVFMRRPNLQRRERLKKERIFQLEDKHYIIFDFGCTLFGYPCITASGMSGDVVDVICGEHLSDNKVLAFTGSRRSLSVLTLKGGGDRWMSDAPLGFRYVMVQVRRCIHCVQVSNVHARVSLARSDRDSGVFECSDDILNRIWRTGVSTLASTIHGSYIDAPCGEQTQYVADAMIQSWAGYHIFGNYELSAIALEDFAGTQLETGQINSACPSGLMQIVPDYSLLWVIWLHRHFTYTGDTELLARLKPAMERLLNHYNSIAAAPDGPLGDISVYVGATPFLDHDDAICRDGICTGLNAIYSRALYCAANLEEYAGCAQMAQLFRGRAASVFGYMQELAWDAEAGLFVDAVSADGETRSNRHSWQSNVLAIYGALADDAEAEMIWNKLFCDDEPYLKFEPGESENPYFKYFMLEVAFGLGHREWALKMLRHYWGAMLSAGASTWWEMFCTRLADDNRIFSRCHGYGASPNAYLISELVGIRPDEVGLGRIVFAPCFLDGIDWVKVNMPTPLGLVAAEWRRNSEGGIDISVSAAYGLEVVPIIGEEYADKVTFNVGSNVIIIQPDAEDADDGGDGDGVEDRAG